YNLMRIVIVLLDNQRRTRIFIDDMPIYVSPAGVIGFPFKTNISPFGMKCTFSALPNSFSRKASHALEAVFWAMAELTLFPKCSRTGFTHMWEAYSVN